jgi:hypothetical protein
LICSTSISLPALSQNVIVVPPVSTVHFSIPLCAKPYFILQLCWYSEQLERLQGVPPARKNVVLGTGETVSFAPREVASVRETVEVSVSARGDEILL